MKIAVINSGSSSLKFKLFDMNNENVVFETLVQEIKNSHLDALQCIIEKLHQKGIDFKDLDALGHRVVHGGEEFKTATLVDDKVIKSIESLSSLAPLHNLANLQGITAIRDIAPNLKQYAIFDTAFHSSMPKSAYMYALPYEMYEKHKIRRYGFHGTSHSYVLKQSAKELNKNVDELNIISLHLGNGASVCAIQNGKSIDTSMGFTPLEGLVMGSRSGDIDPAVVIYMQKELGLSFDEVDNILNKKSGLLGICGENDVRNIVESKDEKAKLALEMMIRRIKKYIGSYMALLGRVDAIVFTGGIGENSEYIRNSVMDNIQINDANILVIKTNEELEIARECKKLFDYN